jgi:4-hydroxybenzoate polyprenyltransferase
VVPPGAPLLIGAGLLLCYLIGLTYVAKQENLGRVENLWPLAFLAAPLVYGAVLATDNAMVVPFLIGLAGWIAVALWFVKRRQAGDIPRAVVSLIAGICLLDAMLIASVAGLGLALLAVLGFLLTLALQRFVPGT